MIRVGEDGTSGKIDRLLSLVEQICNREELRANRPR